MKDTVDGFGSRWRVQRTVCCSYTAAIDALYTNCLLIHTTNNTDITLTHNIRSYAHIHIHTHTHTYTHTHTRTHFTSQLR